MLRTNVQHSGFTLIELLVAITVFSMLAVMSYAGLSSVIDNRQRTEIALTRLSELQKAITTISRDMDQIVHRDIRDELGNTQSFLTSSAANSALVEFTRGGWRNPALLQRSTLQRVSYSIEDSKLLRRQWRHVDKVEGVEPTITTLLEKIQNVQFRFLDISEKWHESWPPQNSSANQNIPGPIAIELKLELNDWGEITRLFRLASGPL